MGDLANGDLARTLASEVSLLRREAPLVLRRVGGGVMAPPLILKKLAIKIVVWIKMISDWILLVIERRYLEAWRSAFQVASLV